MSGPAAVKRLRAQEQKFFCSFFKKNFFLIGASNVVLLVRPVPAFVQDAVSRRVQ
jgi:hypothetical protein